MPKRIPCMPSKNQIKDAYDTASDLCPGARIKCVGPEGVVFDYPENSTVNDWTDKPFSGEAT